MNYDLVNINSKYCFDINKLSLRYRLIIWETNAKSARNPKIKPNVAKPSRLKNLNSKFKSL